MSIIDRLHEKAEIFARQLGCGRFDTRLAEQDFRNYLESDVCGPDPDYPPWGARASWTLHKNAMTTQSGTGNPLSPLIIVGSEFNADPDNYQELYFKYCFDLLWKEIFGIPGCDIVRYRIRQTFLKHWGGAAGNDKASGYSWAPFYKSLRHFLWQNFQAWEDYPFVARHMDWHTSRPQGGSSHQWGKASTIIQWLQHWPHYPEEPTNLKSKGNPDNLHHQNFSNDKIDDFAFFTEASLEAAACSVDKKLKPNNETSADFLEYAINNFKQPRIFLLNPTQKENLQDKLRAKYRDSCTNVNEWQGNKSYPLSLWRHIHGSWIVFVHTNLTGSVSNNKMSDILRLIRKAARRL